MKILELFMIFFKIGSISFGGGYAMIPFLRYETISRGLMDEASILNMIAVSQVTPGPIATNMATFVGYTNGGFLGAVFTTIGVTLPSLLLVLFVTRFILDKLTDRVKTIIFYGLRPTVCALLFITATTLPFKEFFANVDFSKINSILPNINYFSFFLALFTYISIKKYNKPIPTLLICGFISVIYRALVSYIL